MTIEYRVRRVERFIVTRYESAKISIQPGACPPHDNVASSSRQIGKEFDNFDTAYEVATALARAEQERLGLPPGDGGVIFPSAALEDARSFTRPLETYHSSNLQIGGVE